MQPRFVTVLVEEHDGVPEGCCLRFKLVDEPRPVELVRYKADVAEGDVWRVESREADGSVGVAWEATVEDSGAGTCVLLYGGARGLGLRSLDGKTAIVEPYLLLSLDSQTRSSIGVEDSV